MSLADAPTPPTPVPTHAELFVAFFRVTLSGFGGTLPWARKMFVEDKRWMTAEEFNDIYALCQFLPGPNVVNLTAVFGARKRGITGALAAWTGFLVFPLGLMIVAGMLYGRYGDVELLRRGLLGLAAAGSGLLLATALKMARPLFDRIGPGPVMAVATALAIGVMRWPLFTVLAVLAPLSIALTWWWGSRR